MELQFFIFDLLSSMAFVVDTFADSDEVRLRSQFWKKPLKQHGVLCQNTFNFFKYLVIIRHYFTGNRRLSCILATISDGFPDIKI